ncbi:hypothetical protein RJ640_001990 [Escallonia rubra]|uniref:Uncharacterized protein n=1 Tax=Escallonia rubra TaxID=112253 RepID=A0AA88UK25_9ASTE|nr:hypothetical protein RJ640_001990 [Escallonia rubra]
MESQSRVDGLTIHGNQFPRQSLDSPSQVIGSLGRLGKRRCSRDERSGTTQSRTRRSPMKLASIPYGYSECSGTGRRQRLLEVTHKGTNQANETKINMLVQQYEAFKMKKNESINEMYSRFTLIINRLKLLGTVYHEKEMGRKVLRSLPKRWEVKAIFKKLKT